MEPATSLHLLGPNNLWAPHLSLSLSLSLSLPLFLSYVEVSAATSTKATVNNHEC